jgi:hypothetical protein
MNHVVYLLVCSPSCHVMLTTITSCSSQPSEGIWSQFNWRSYLYLFFFYIWSFFFVHPTSLLSNFINHMVRRSQICCRWSWQPWTMTIFLGHHPVGRCRLSGSHNDDMNSRLITRCTESVIIIHILVRRMFHKIRRSHESKKKKK